MSLKDKKKELIILAVLLAVIIVILFFPGKEQQEEQEQTSEWREEEQNMEDLIYMKTYAWYTDRGNDRYWLIFSPEGLEGEDDTGSAISYIEHTDIEMSGRDFNGRFSDAIHYEDISISDGTAVIESEDAGSIEGRYEIDRKGKTLTFFPVDPGEDGRTVYRATPVDELVYPVYTYGMGH